jgi:hypothetical protein
MGETYRTLQYAGMNGRGTMKEEADITDGKRRLHIITIVMKLELEM